MSRSVDVNRRGREVEENDEEIVWPSQCYKIILLWILVKLETGDGFICKVPRIRLIMKEIFTQTNRNIFVRVPKYQSVDWYLNLSRCKCLNVGFRNYHELLNENMKCGIYGERPLQCSTYPFWLRIMVDRNDEFVDNDENESFHVAKRLRAYDEGGCEGMKNRWRQHWWRKYIECGIRTIRDVKKIQEAFPK